MDIAFTSLAPRLVVPVGHTSAILSAAFSPDGKLLLTADDNGDVKLWNCSGKELQTFSGHANHVVSVAFSPDGKQTLTGSMDGTAKLWDLSGRELQTFPGHDTGVFVAFSPDGKAVLTAPIWNGTAKLWDLSGKELQVFTGDIPGFTNAAFSPDGKHLLTGCRDNTAKLWDVKGKQLQTFPHTKNVLSAAFTPDGKKVLTSSWDQTVKLWDLSGKELQASSFAKSFQVVAFSPDGKHVLASSIDNKLNTAVKLWDLSGKELQTFSNDRGDVRVLVFSPDGKRVLTSDGEIAKLWDLSGKELQTFTGYARGFGDVAFSPDGKQVLMKMHYPYGKTGLWDLSGKELQTFSHLDGDDWSLSSVSPGIKYSLAKGAYNTAVMFDDLGNAVQTFSGHTDSVMAFVFSPDRKQVLTGSLDRTAKLWDLSGKELQTFSGHEDVVVEVAFSPDGKTVLTSSEDRTVKWWDLSGKVLQTFRHAHRIHSVAFSPDGTHVLTSGGTAAKLWGLSGELQTFAHGSGIGLAIFSPDGKLALTSGSATSKIWDIHTGNLLNTLTVIDSTDWVVTTPSGLFDASPGAMHLMYYVQGLEVIDLEQLKKRYWLPGLLPRLLGFADGNLPDVSEFGVLPLYPVIDAAISGDTLHIQLTERDGGLGKLSLFVNNKELVEDLNPGPNRKTTLHIDLNLFADFYPPGENTIALRAFNSEGWLKSQDYRLPYTPSVSAKGQDNNAPGNTQSLAPAKAHLYAIVVGTGQYLNPQMVLKFPDVDAAVMADALKAAGKGLFEDRVHLRLLSTAKGKTAEELANKKNIEAAFLEVQQQAKPNDIVVAYFSGHGITYGAAENSQFYYLTKDVPNEDLSDPEVTKQSTVSQEELTDWLKAITAQKQVVIFDACNAGAFARNFEMDAAKEINSYRTKAFDEMKGRTGTFILAGAAGDKVSFESSKYGQGLLTYSLLEGIRGMALNEKRVDVSKLFDHACKRVPQLAAGINKVQVPVMAFPEGTGATIFIGIVDKETKLPRLAEPKKVYIRPRFGTLPDNDDELELEEALVDEFTRLTAHGAVAPIVYVDVNQYEDGYKISGTYTLESNGTVNLNGQVKKGKTVLGEFLLTGKKDDVPGLASQIWEKASEF